MKLFLDTNVIIDDMGKRGESAKTMELLHIVRLFGDVELAVSAKSYTDAFCVLKKYVDSRALQQEIKDTLQMYQVCSVDSDDIAAACELNWNDFEDALIAVSAEKMGADYLITNDTSFEQRPVPTLTPQGFIDLMHKKGITYAMVDLGASEA
jgi:predicted nucleic acid-binding protein